VWPLNFSPEHAQFGYNSCNTNIFGYLTKKRVVTFENIQKIIIFVIKELKKLNKMTKYTTTRQALDEVYEQINWAYLAKNYFGKTRSWLYNKFSGTNNGKPDDFSEVDRQTLKSALLDISKKLTEVADKL
jgi:hypothetical protein